MRYFVGYHWILNRKVKKYGLDKLSEGFGNLKNRLQKS